MKAIWNGVILAESDDTKNIENNEYFPPSSVNMEFFLKVETQSACPWKGLASYYNIIVDGKINPDAAWYYAEPKKLAEPIRNYVAFWRGVKIVK